MTIDYIAPERRAEAFRGVDPANPTTIRPALRALRVSIADLARRSGVDYSRCEKILNGRAKAKPEESAALAEALGLEASA